MASFINGSGTTVTYASLTAVVRSCQWTGCSRAAVETSSLTIYADKMKTFVVGSAYDPGEIQIVASFTHAECVTLLTAAAGTVTLDTGTESVAASGFCTSADASAGIDEVETANITFKLTGSVTPSPV